jgi:CubicO group peptidase (beta-lactamase class C family)
MRKFVAAITILVLTSYAAVAQSASSAAKQPSDNAQLASKVDQLFSRWDKLASPGAAVVVVKDGAIIYKHGYGCANLEYDVPITPSTIFHVASVSKQFTAFAIALLASRGKLSLDDDIRKYLPEVPDFGKTITIRHLLHHTSGLRDQWELLAMAGWRLDDVITKEHILKMVHHERELNFDPGSEFLYCNTGFTLLAVIVERVSDQSFRQFTEDNIFKPLGMVNTHFHDDHQMIVKNRAYSYIQAGNGFKLSALNYANVGATSLFTTVEDLAKWALNFEDMKVGGPSVIDEMLKQGVLNNGKTISYALGLEIGDYKGLKSVAHGGGDAGYRTYIMRIPEQRFAVAVLSNLGSFNPGMLAQQVSDIYLADKFPPAVPKPPPVERVPAKVDPKIYDAYVGRYRFPEGLLITITKENDRLWGQPAGSSRAELFPESETKFFAQVTDAQVSFQRDEKGAVNQMTLHQNGRDLVGKRAEPVSFSTEKLKEYTGDYYSDELGTSYTIAIQEDGLVAQHRRHSDIKLMPVDADNFSGAQWFFQRVRFTRDKDGHVTGFRLTGSRVRNMRFEKRAS